MSRKDKRKLRQEGILDKQNKVVKGKFNIVNIQDYYTLTSKQQQVIESWDSGNHLVLHGLAGTGKTWLACWLALETLLEGDSECNKTFLFRSVVPTRDMGFLPGNVKQKAAIYEDPYRSICTELFHRGDAYDIVKQKNLLEFSTTSFLRGLTFDRSIIIADEINNMSFHELDSLITRAGKHTRIILCGDFRQSDLQNSAERDGLMRFLKILNTIRGFDYFEFEEDDIVRSKLVKDYIIAKHKSGYV